MAKKRNEAGADAAALECQGICETVHLMGSRLTLVMIALALFLAIAAALPCAAVEPAVPPYAGHVTDAAGVMGEWAPRTEKLCLDIEKQTTAEVAVLTVKSTAPLEAQQYAQKVFDQWKVGKKGKDNGILFLVAVDDRKMWIATGYGLEGQLPDGKVGEIRDRVMLPLFRQGRFGEGIFMGVKSAGSVLGVGPIDAKETAPKKSKKAPFPIDLILFLLFGGFFLLRGLFSSLTGRRRGGGSGMYLGGGGFGGGGFGGGGFGGFGGGFSGGGGAGGGW